MIASDLASLSAAQQCLVALRALTAPDMLGARIVDVLKADTLADLKEQIDPAIKEGHADETLTDDEVFEAETMLASF